LKIYLLPGLGADERIFRYLDIGEHNVVPLKWHAPIGDEPIEAYAKKLSQQIQGDDMILIGMSFGGIMAIELGKIMKANKIILISSIASFDELPLIYRLAGKTRIHRLLTGGVLKSSYRLMNWVMGATDPIRKELLAHMLRDTDERFLRWALHKIVTWKNSTVPSNVYRIHGTNDRVLPLRHADFIINNGGHLSVANRAEEVTLFIRKILATPNADS